MESRWLRTTRQQMGEETSEARVRMHLRDSDRRSARSHSLKSILDHSLRMRVKRGSGFVQEEDTGILEDRSSDGDLWVKLVTKETI